jgi:hypothetical protein
MKGASRPALSGYGTQKKEERQAAMSGLFTKEK